MRVLLVDDAEPWRRRLRDLIERTGKWEVVAEALDGPDAIDKAGRHDPDLVLLDLGLPTLGGIQVARRMRRTHPSRRILFVTEHRSFADAAIGAGGGGYVIKSDVLLDLLPAMDAVMEGRRFISATAAGPRLESEPRHGHRHRHEGVFCSKESTLLDTWTEEAAAALSAGRSVILVASKTRLQALNERLRRAGVDLDDAIAENRYVVLDVADMLTQFMTPQGPDEALLEQAVSTMMIEALKASTAPTPGVLVCGEIAPALWQAGDRAAAVRVEQLWEQVSRAHAVETVCGYIIKPDPSVSYHVEFSQINAVHTAVFGV